MSRSSSDSVPTCYIFSTRSDAEKAFPGEVIVSARVLDISYDQNVKFVMSPNAATAPFLMHFLNALYYPDAKDDDIMIREITPLDKEMAVLGSTRGKGSMTCDLACLCHSYAPGATAEERILTGMDIEV